MLQNNIKYNPAARQEQTDDSTERKSFYSVLAGISFTAFLFFTFFGTSIPFQDRIRDVADIASSNIVNQIVFSSLFVLSIISLIPKFDELVSLIRREKFLFLFLFWCLLSILWSDYKFVTFKRLFQTLTATLVISSFLLHHGGGKNLVKHIRIILLPYLILSLAACLFIAGAKDPQFGYWRGFAFTKNVFGQVTVICIILSFITFRNSKKMMKSIAVLMILISFSLLFGSRSSTSIISVVVILALGFLTSADEIFKPIGLGKTVSFFVMATLFFIIIAVAYFDPDLWKAIPEAAGKDVSFTGRTDLWSYIILEIQKHPLLGAGYQAFWVVESPNVLMLYEVFTWLPNQAHNGYLDMINEVGLIGFIIFLAMIFYYFLNVIRMKEKHTWVWIVIAVLIINFQEGTLFRPGNLTGIFFILAYLVLFVQPEKTEAGHQARNKYLTNRYKTI